MLLYELQELIVAVKDVNHRLLRLETMLNLAPTSSRAAKNGKRSSIAWTPARKKKHALAIKRGQKRALAEKKAATRKAKSPKKKNMTNRAPGAPSSVEKTAA